MKFNKVWDKIKDYSGYFFEEEAREMYRILNGLDKDALVVELGSLYGRSSIVIGEASVVQGFKFICIDSFTVEGKDAKEAFTKNVLLKYDNCHLLEGYSDDWAKHWVEEIDYLFIDACHEEHGIKADCKNWLPFLKSGGVAQFHDYANDLFPHLSTVVDSFTIGWETIGIHDLSCFKRKP